MIRILLLSLILLGFSFTGISQKAATLRGYVKAASDEEALSSVSVVLTDTVKGTKKGDWTSDIGRFQIPGIAPGTYKITVRTPSYNVYEQTITLKSGEIKNFDVLLEESQLGPVTIIGEGDSKVNVQISVTPVTKKDIKSVPKIGGTNDIINYLTAAVPGALTTGDQGGQVYIRGGSPIQNKVLLDGMIIYNPFHSIGFFSVFDTDIISSADIYTGGFNAEYGGRISSVMDIKTIDGNKNDVEGVVEVTPFGSKVSVNGPIWNNSKEGGSSASYVFSGKSSYLEQSSKLFYTYVNGDEGLPFNFTDIYGKFAVSSPGGSKFNLFGFNYRDDVRYQAISDLSWNSWGIGSNFTLVPSSSTVLVEGDFSYSNYDITLKEEGLADRFSKVDGFNFGMDFTYYVGESDIKYGIDIQGFKTSFSTFNAVNRVIDQEENTTEMSGYVRYKFISQNKLWVLDPSFRLHYYASLRTASPEPRLGLKFNASERLRLKGAVGIYSQNLISANSDRDVVNLFYGFLSGPDNLQDEFIRQNGNVKEITHNLQKANHFILGFEYDILKKTVEKERAGRKIKDVKKVTLNVEGYIKDFTQLTNMNRNKIFEEDQFDKPDVLKKDFIIETGLARGVDFLLKYSDENKFIWVVYSIGKVDRWDGFIEYAPVFDRRHNVNVVGTTKFGKDDSWELNVRWNFGSGFPFTKTAGFYEAIDFTDGISTDYTTVNANQISTQYDSLNKGRLPTYHRSDITLTKSFKFYRNNSETAPSNKDLKSSLDVSAGVTNVYNRENVFYVNRLTGEVVRQLPIMPSIGLTYAF